MLKQYYCTRKSMDKSIKSGRTNKKRITMPFRYWHDFEHCKEVASQCSGPFDFHERFRAAYRAAKQEGFYNHLYQLFWAPDNWNFERCRDIASKYTNRAFFYREQRLAYKAAEANGWLDPICSHMYDSECYWTYEKCKEEFKRYKTKIELVKDNDVAYRSALHNGWWKELSKNFDVIRRDKFTFDDCLKTALMYNRIVDFQKADQAKYNAAHKNNWLKDICAHMTHRIESWTLELLQGEAEKYKHKIDFLKGNESAYVVASRKGVLDIICSHMEDLGDLYNRAIYAWEFPDNHVYVGLTCNLDRRSDQHHTDDNSAVKQYAIKTGLTPTCRIIYDYVPVSEAKRLEGDTLNEYMAQGWKKLNKIKTGGIGAIKAKYTPEYIEELAKSCSSRQEFRERYILVYQACSKKKLMYVLDKVLPKERWTDKFGNVHTTMRRKWGEEKIWGEVRKYTSYHDFLKNSRKAQKAADKYGLIARIKLYYENL